MVLLKTAIRRLVCEQADFVSSYNGQTIRIFLEYIYETGKWEISSVHPYSQDIVTNHFDSRR